MLYTCRPAGGLLLGTNSFYRHIAPLGLLVTVINCHGLTLSGFLLALVQPGGNAQAKHLQESVSFIKLTFIPENRVAQVP